METDLTTLEKVRTRQRLSPDERIPQILDAALAEFTRCGFAAARMDDIAARCGLSKGGLYAHFGAKEALFVALMQRELVPPDLAPLHALAQRGESGEADRLAEALVDELHRQLMRPSVVAVLRLLVAERERVPQRVAQWHQALVRPWLELLGELLASLAGPDHLLGREPWLAIAPAVHLLTAQLVLGEQAPQALAQARQAHVDMLRGLLSAPARAA